MINYLRQPFLCGKTTRDGGYERTQISVVERESVHQVFPVRPEKYVGFNRIHRYLKQLT